MYFYLYVQFKYAQFLSDRFSAGLNPQTIGNTVILPDLLVAYVSTMFVGLISPYAVTGLANLSTIDKASGEADSFSAKSGIVSR